MRYSTIIGLALGLTACSEGRSTEPRSVPATDLDGHRNTVAADNTLPATASSSGMGMMSDARSLPVTAIGGAPNPSTVGALTPPSDVAENVSPSASVAGGGSAPEAPAAAPAPPTTTGVPLAPATTAAPNSEPAAPSPVALPPSNNTSLPGHWHESGGWGSHLEGGLGGRVIKVTNLNNSGPGSLREAVGASGKRLVVFEVGGVIDLEGEELKFRNGDITVAGQTAPSPGITVIRAFTRVSGPNTVISHVAFRLGDEVGHADTIGIDGPDIVLNHVSASWSVDECITLQGAKTTTMYKTMVTEALSLSVHEEGEHSKGSLISRATDTTSLIGMLYAHNALRNPRLKDLAQIAMVNSVIYDWFPGHDDEGEKKFHYVVSMANAKLSMVGNVAIQGPESVGEILIAGHKHGTGEAYMEDNVIIDPAGNPLTEFNPDNITPLDAPPLWPEGLVAIPSHEALYEVLRTVGSRPGDRDPTDARVVQSVADGTGGRVDSQNDVEGYPTFSETRHDVTVPDGVAARRAWLDELEDEIAVDRSIDLSRLYGLVGSAESDKLR